MSCEAGGKYASCLVRQQFGCECPEPVSCETCKHKARGIEPGSPCHECVYDDNKYFRNWEPMR